MPESFSVEASTFWGDTSGKFLKHIVIYYILQATFYKEMLLQLTAYSLWHKSCSSPTQHVYLY